MKQLPKVLLAFYWIAIFTATHLPKSSIPSLDYSDKFYHCAAYGGLAFLLCWNLLDRVPAVRNVMRQAIMTLGICLAYAIFDENTQRLMPGRTYDIYDICADMVGALLGVAACLIAKRLLSSNANQVKQDSAHSNE